jgi:ParB-like chromosome segregation protein Spo0J
MWKTERVKPYGNNPRVNDSAVGAVAKSIEEFGFRQPIVVDKEGAIVVGHTRWKAARKLGLKTVPVHVATDLTPAQARAYRIADNKTAELAEWDDGRLATELEALRHANGNLEALAFTPKELATLLGTAQDSNSLQYAMNYEVIVECSDEAEQRRVYEKMSKEEYRCRVLTY